MTYTEEYELKVGCIDSEDILDMFKSADEDIATLQAKNEALQAKIDDLMLEFCPDECDRGNRQIGKASRGWVNDSVSP